LDGMERVRVLKEGWYRGRRLRPGEVLEVPEEDLANLVKEGRVEWLLEEEGPARGGAREGAQAGPAPSARAVSESTPPKGGAAPAPPREAPAGAEAGGPGRKGVVVVTTLERLLEDFRREEERTRRVGEVLEVARKLVEMGWIEDSFGQPELREKGVELPGVRLKQRYSLNQIGEWAGARITLRVGTLEDLPLYVGKGADRWERLRRLGFETVARGDKVLARKVLATCGSAAAWLEAE